MFPSKRILILGSVISLPLIYGNRSNNFGEELDKYLLAAVYPTDKKKLKTFTDQRNRMLRLIALMQLYACPRKANDEIESSDKVLDCSDFFKNSESLKVEFKEIWENGGKRSKADRTLADRPGKDLTGTSGYAFLVKLKEQSTSEDQLVVQKLLTSEVRPHFSRFVKEIREEKEEA